MDISFKDILPAITGIAGGAGGVLTTVWKSARTARGKLDALKQEIDALRTRRVEDKRRFEEHKTKAEERHEELEQELEAMKKDLLKRLEAVVNSTGRTREALNAMRTQAAAHRARLDILDTKTETLRDQMSMFVKTETFNHFTKEQQDQWLKIQHNVGEIQGILKSQ